MLLLDTNVLLHVADEHSDLHEQCRAKFERWHRDATPLLLTWSICYEFLKVSTNPRVFHSPLSVGEAWRFIAAVLNSPGGAMLTATDRHATILARTVFEIPDLRGKVLHDVHTAVLMREHGVSRICTRDADFRRFPFLTVVDPLA